MEFTATSKTVTMMAAGILFSGFAVILRSASGDNVAGSIGGACLVMVGLTLLILVFVRHWVVNTRDERRALLAAQRQAQEERTTYVAGKAAIENELGRLTRDMAAKGAHLAATLAAERAKMRAAFEEERAQMMSEAFRTGAEMERAGMLRPDRPDTGNLIPFPKQAHEQAQNQAPQQERSRERGVSGP